MFVDLLKTWKKKLLNFLDLYFEVKKNIGNKDFRHLQEA